jgi:deoxyribodipyrimidine photo-lyase
VSAALRQTVHVVWFKRDLRVLDHAPLAQAADRGRVLPLYVIEPSLLAAPDFDALHFEFIRECLVELRETLHRRGAPLIVRVGEVVDVLRELAAGFELAGLWSHEETGNAVTYARDRAVAAWCRAQGIPWVEVAQSGVVRRLESRDGWSREWSRRMRMPLTPAPALSAPAGLDPGRVPTADDLGLRHACAAVARRSDVQVGGEHRALATLEAFLAGRGARYAKEMSSPITAPSSCSRLSPYLAWGAISMRTVVQRAETALAEAAQGNASIPRGSLRAFLGRLHWHCHFIQKLESEPAIEHRCFNRACEGLRSEARPAHFAAWCEGRTGYPFVDACMRYLQTHGWINFRMRAMLVSFAAYDLWLDWRSFRDFLARQFIDYEPGIHYSQLQMQSGVTGINTLRIYSPVKQGIDQDRDGVFVRRWCPELAGVPATALHTPWVMSSVQQRKAGCVLDRDYPRPIVDHAAAVRYARAQFADVRRSAFGRQEAERVYELHGSRRGPPGSAQRRRSRARRLTGADEPEFGRTRERRGDGNSGQLGLALDD